MSGHSVTMLGTGLIGGSLGLALRQLSDVEEIVDNLVQSPPDVRRRLAYRVFRGPQIRPVS